MPRFSQFARPFNEIRAAAGRNPAATRQLITIGVGLAVGTGLSYASAPKHHKAWGLVGGVPGGLAARVIYGNDGRGRR